MIAEVHTIPFTPIIGHTISLFGRSKSRLESLDMIFYEADENVNMVKAPLYINNKPVTYVEVPEQFKAVRVALKLTADIGLSEEQLMKRVIKYVKIKSVEVANNKIIEGILKDKENKYELVFNINNKNVTVYAKRADTEGKMIKVVNYNIQLFVDEVKQYKDGRFAFVKTALNYIVQALSTIYTEFVRFLKSIVALVKSAYSKIKNKLRKGGEPAPQIEAAFINILAEKFKYEAVYFEAEGEQKESLVRRLMAKVLEFLKSIYTDAKKGLANFGNWIVKNIKSVLAILIGAAYNMSRKMTISLRKLYMRFNNAATVAAQVDNSVKVEEQPEAKQSETEQPKENQQKRKKKKDKTEQENLLELFKDTDYYKLG